MQLKPGTELQNGKYRIIKTLGQGGFGITYLAEQTGLHRKVAIKEFFMKEYCERDDATSQVSLGTSRGSKDLVARFRGKFVREAQMIAELEHPNIVKIHDVFEENGTAYYVMQFLAGESLSERVKSRGVLPEGEALGYIRQIGKALEYVHARKFLHFDVKPSNILVNESGDAVLIDFGVSKHYDESGSQTSSTPVGISKGYAPLEQYQQNEISTFTPATDIYALGATLYTLLTGSVPPSASEVNEDGLPALPERISKPVRDAIEKAMQPRRKDRPQTVAAFLSLLSASSVPSSSPAASESATEETEIVSKPTPRSTPKPQPQVMPSPAPSPRQSSSPAPALSPASVKKPSKAWLWALLGGLAVAMIIAAIVLGGRKDRPAPVEQQSPVDTTAVETPVETETPPAAFPGSVKLSSTPSGATIWLDGKNTRKTTPEILEDLTPGKHSLKLTLDGYNDYAGSVTITSGKRSETSPTLTAKEKPVVTAKLDAELGTNSETVIPGSIKISSTPSGAAIWFDGKNTKRITPAIIEDIFPGEHTVKLVLDGYEDGNDSVTVTSGLRVDIAKTLTTRPVQVSTPTQPSVESKPVVAEKPTTGTIRNFDWIDLGLPSGLKWATCNVGASSPSDYGSYFAWGETSSKSDYSWETLRYRIRGNSYRNVKFSKYNTSSASGTVDSKKILELSDDAARANWGGSWRMPTQNEFQELINHCKWEWTTQGGKKGYKVSSRTNGNSIFLPAAGYCDEGLSNGEGWLGNYWTSSLRSVDPGRAVHLEFNSVERAMDYDSRNRGMPVRPVSE